MFDLCTSVRLDYERLTGLRTFEWIMILGKFTGVRQDYERSTGLGTLTGLRTFGRIVNVGSRYERSSEYDRSAVDT